MIQDQAAKQAALALAQDKPQALALDQDPVLDKLQDQALAQALALVQVPDNLVPDRDSQVQAQDSQDRVTSQAQATSQVLEISQDQVLVLELAQAKSQPTHIPTSFIPEMEQSNMVASLTATPVATPTITPTAIPTTVIPQTTISKISTEKMDKAEENNPPLSPRLRKVSISKGYKQLGSRTNQEKKEYQNNGRKRANDSRIQ